MYYGQYIQVSRYESSHHSVTRNWWGVLTPYKQKYNPKYLGQRDIWARVGFGEIFGTAPVALLFLVWGVSSKFFAAFVVQILRWPNFGQP
eukprot:COSAG01_NODE_1491_length_10131_cov_5.872508_2_plen_90_part_00